VLKCVSCDGDSISGSNFAIFHAPVHKICKGFVDPGTRNFIEELIFYQSGIAEMVNMRKFVRQGPHGRGPIEKFDPP